MRYQEIAGELRRGIAAGEFAGSESGGPGLLFVTLPLAFAAVPFGMIAATVFDHLTSNVMLPIGGLALALFVGWSLPSRFLIEELQLGHAATVILRVLLRYVALAAIAAVSLAPFLV